MAKKRKKKFGLHNWHRGKPKRGTTKKGIPIIYGIDRYAKVRCPKCGQAKRAIERAVLSEDAVILLDTLRAIYDNANGGDGDKAFMRIEDVTEKSRDREFGSIRSRDNNRTYRAPVRLARVAVRILEKFNLVEYEENVGHRLNDEGRGFLDGIRAVPIETVALSGSCLLQDDSKTVMISDFVFTPDPNRKPVLYDTGTEA